MQVTIYASFVDSSTCFVKWQFGGSKGSQKLLPRNGWQFLNRHDWHGTQWTRPTAGIWRIGKGGDILWILNYEESGVYGYAALDFFEFAGNRWVRLKDPIRGPVEFSDRGTFWIDGSKLWICDFWYDTNYAHMDDQPYLVSEFVYKPHRIVLHHSVRTKRRYSPESTEPGTVGEIPEIVSPQRDPMREFGMQWRWWGAKLPDERS